MRIIGSKEEVEAARLKMEQVLTVEKQKLNLGCIKLQSDPAILYYPHPKDGSLKGLVG